MNFEILRSSLILICLTSFQRSDFVFGQDDEETNCDSELAMSCFSDVQDDLGVIFNPSNYYSQSRNETVLHDLCSAWDDSLSCISDIIDGDAICTKDTDRKNMDHWIVALRNIWNYVCAENATVLNEIFRNVDCFNILEFLECTEKTANLSTFKDVMKTKLDEKECRYLKNTTMKCGEYVSYGICAQEPILSLQKVLNVFFQTGHCADIVSSGDTDDESDAHHVQHITSEAIRLAFNALVLLVSLHVLLIINAD